LQNMRPLLSCIKLAPQAVPQLAPDAFAVCSCTPPSWRFRFLLSACMH
jgi:hypothetical protein